jgi:hypothetical protein
MTQRLADADQYNSLRTIIAKLPADKATELRNTLNAKHYAGELTFEFARELIMTMTAKPKPITEDGMYQQSGMIFKVQRSGSGRLYAKELMQDEDGNWHFEYAPGAVRNLRNIDKMTMEQAKEFGALYGTCCVCGRTLTNEESIAAGIGPVCAGRF